MATKTVSIYKAGTEGREHFKDVQLLPGTKAGDVLDKLGLKGFVLSKPDGGAFKRTDDLYATVEDGQKLFATPADVTAG